MKKLIIIPLAFLILNFSLLIGFAQTTGDKEVVKLSKDITTLKQENNKLKKEVVREVNTLNKSIEDMKGLYQGADNRINIVKDLHTATSSATSSTISTLQEDTNNRFLRYRSIIKIAIILSLLVMGALTGMIILLFFKLKKGLDIVRNNLYINEKALSNLSDKLAELKDDFSRQINSTHETLNAKINETHKLLDGQIAQANKTSESSNAKIKEQFEKEISHTKQLTVDQIIEVKKETAAHLNTFKTGFEAQIGEVQKTINAKLTNK